MNQKSPSPVLDTTPASVVQGTQAWMGGALKDDKSQKRQKFGVKKTYLEITVRTRSRQQQYQ